MDIARHEVKSRRRMLQMVYLAGGLIILALVTAELSRLKAAAPTVDKTTVWTDTVKRGPMLREVRGLGTLVPETIRLIPAATDGRVERRLLLPGTLVNAKTVILELSNAELQQSVLDAGFQLKGAEAEYNNLKAQLDNELMEQRSKAAGVRSQFRQAQLQHEADDQLYKAGITAEIVWKTSQVKAEELGKQYEIAEKQVDTFGQSIEAQLAAQQAKINGQRALCELKQHQLDQLDVRPGIDGVLQELAVEVGQQVTPGTILARVAQPSHLKAELKIAETQAKDVAIGQRASIDTHNGAIPGHVTRIDPSVQNGTVTVDAALDGTLPPGSRPDLSVEGTIEIERLADVLSTGRPVHGDTDSTVGLFKVLDDGSEAVRVQVKLGRTSVNSVEILQGLSAGDQVILSDMSAWDNFDRVRLR
jgi:multidrug efflux pump subunit AcrA (membrane-fusion protein)